MAKLPTVYDVAERSNVSIATVSRVLRSPDAVREQTRERVLEAVRYLGYVPSGNARALAARRTNVIGLFFPGHDDLDATEILTPGSSGEVPIVVDDGSVAQQSENLYFDEVLRGAEIEAWRHGLALMVAAGRGASREALVNDIAGRVDGLAVLARTVPDELLAHVARRIPVVVLAGSQRDDGFDHVSASNGPGMRTLASHVFETHGVRDPIYIAGPTDSPDDAERREGFREALRAAGIAEDAVTLERGDFTREGGRAIAERLVERGALGRETPGAATGTRPPGVRAVICSNDQTALGVLDVLEARGIRVPHDVLVTGFDGITAGAHSRPRLTTVHQPMVELGRAAVHAITARLDDPTLGPQSLTLPVSVVLRDSCP
ncbi:LacI family DNA-binding transcriptional regulator [Conyzicola sp.]|uniref:LacI family DNA-binding transcriptional regulator n=1 Tax=Conyzicola sp. TaxID=1969404 RepID=UPI003988F14B